MAKEMESAELQSKAERKVAKAQTRLRAAEDEYSKAKTRGERKIKKARLKAEVIRAEAAELVQRRAAAVARAESRLAGLTEEADAARHGGGEGAPSHSYGATEYGSVHETQSIETLP